MRNPLNWMFSTFDSQNWYNARHHPWLYRRFFGRVIVVWGLVTLIVWGLLFLLFVGADYKFNLGLIVPEHHQAVSIATPPISSATQVLAKSPTVKVMLSPTRSPTPASFTFGHWDSRWYSVKDMGSLFAQQNVINFAACGNGICHYMRNMAIVFSPQWKPVGSSDDVVQIQQAGPTSFTFYEKDGTSADDLNVYQAFVLSSNPTKVYLVDSLDQLWEVDYNPSLFVSLKQAQAQLPNNIVILPNNNLTRTS